MENAITEEDFWGNFWAHVKLPCKVNPHFSNDHIIAEFLKNTVPKGQNKKIALEVGCAPGKWMIFLDNDLNYITEGCEYLESAVKITQRNLQMSNIDNAVIHPGDFLSYDFGGDKYDLVISLGFIEHFSNPTIVIEKMYKILKKDGVLVIGIPNFTGLNNFVARNVDKTLKNKLLPAHNLKIMNLQYFHELSENKALKPIKITYRGGFEPALYNISTTPEWFKFLFNFITFVFHSKIAQFISCGFYSSYILAAYNKV